MSHALSAYQSTATTPEIAGHPLREVEIDGQRYREWAGYLFRMVRRGKVNSAAFEMIPRDAHGLRLMILEALA